jgi:3-oxoacyl-[acyl-carrier protein] reductase
MFENKVVLITGGSRGIGAALVDVFAEHGATVVFTYQTSSALANTIEQKWAGKSKVKAYQADASLLAESEKVVEQILKDFGTIDILVNNAGVTKDNLLLRMSEQQWDDVINTNLKSVFNYSKSVLKPMVKAKSGCIINITSYVGISGNAGQINYAASKAGIIGFTKSLAKEMGVRNIRCNAVAPGFIETEMTENISNEVKEKYLSEIPLKRFGSAKEVADLVLFLSSEKAAYINGQVISICGGIN